MKKLTQVNNISLGKIFISLLKINTFTFGGGYTIVPIIKQEFVENLKVMSEEDMMSCVSLSASVPGALAISTSYLVGYKLRGILGGIIAVLASVLPCLVIISVISIAYHSFITNIYIKAILQAVGAMVSAILVITVIKMIKKIEYKFIPLLIIMFIASYFFKIKLAILLIISAVIGLIEGIRRC